MSTENTFEREKWLADLELRKREVHIQERAQATRDAELELRKREQASATWRSPLTVAVLAAAAAAGGNAVVTLVNGNLQRDLESRKREAEINLERSKAESTRILEMIKTGDTEKAAGNLEFLLQSGLVSDPLLTAKLRDYLKSREPGSGPSLPTPNGRVGFEQSTLLSQPLQVKLQTLLDGYFNFLDKVGFPASKDKVTIRIEERDIPNAYYSEGAIVIDRRMADDPSVALREYNHHVLNVRTRAWRGNYAAIESGLADYFACSFLGDPRLGRSSAKAYDPNAQFIRNLDNSKHFADLQNAKEYEYPYVGAEVWGGAFWRLRAKLGHEVSDRVLASAWLKRDLPAQDAQVTAAFLRALLAEVATRAPDSDGVNAARAILKAQGFPIPE